VVAPGARRRYTGAMAKSSKRANRALLILMIGMMAAVAVTVVTMWYVVSSGPRDPGDQSTSASSVGGPFTLVDQNGATVTDKSYGGLYRLIYFGYTFCPDACPTELQLMSQAIENLGADGAKVQPIFITIDPARDTPAQLAAYVKQFDPRLVGLSGSPEQIAQAARAYKVFYAKEELPGDRVNYAMDHSSFVYLMGPRGNFLTVFTPDMDADKMAAEIKSRMKG